MPHKEWETKRNDFAIPPNHMMDADYELDYSPLNTFQQDRHGKYGMQALTPHCTSARYNPTFNGFKSIDPNNPSINETVKQTLRKNLKENKNMKHKVKLNERQLHNVIKTAVKKILREDNEYEENEDVFDLLLYYLEMGMRQCEEEGDTNSQTYQLMQQLYDSIHYGEEEEEPEYFDNKNYYNDNYCGELS